MQYIKRIVYGLFLTLLISSSSYADCTYELFSISSTKDTKIIDFIEQLSDECEFSIIVTDPHAEKFLKTKLNKTHLKNLTIDEVLSIILKENNLYYTLENNILKISYLSTKVFNVDYILSQRKGTGSTNITLSSSSTGSTDTTTTSSGSNSESGIKIESTDEVKFWEELDLELQHIINTSQDLYKSDAPIINKNAGLITVTTTLKQMNRLEGYLKKLQDKVQLQVLIDVQILSVTIEEGKTTGIDWSQLYALQNITLALDYKSASNVGTFADNLISTTDTSGKNESNLISVQAGGSLDEVIKFLETQGDVVSISNPKVLTLNNQPALITAGTEYFYTLTSTETSATSGGSTTSEDNNIQSVFAGVLLDITPEISDDKSITLKINPSISETAQDISAESSSDRDTPPDLVRRQLSSVVTVKDGKRIILGGLIITKNTMDSNQVPILGSIPILGYLFKYEEMSKQVQEIVVVIQPHIIDRENNNLSLAELGYTGITNKSITLNKSSISKETDKVSNNVNKELNKEVKEEENLDEF
ncbi:pilus (MSHA type) biogenesis protein MshL [Sulfurimonas sp.]|uniref:pilus (MSHA type) biogenesis protein MshL n=1 Tax=Sulfurimonas sp. TaxID=2022749 RepID=UPI0025D43D99|nr:pilus (MSHA type) biogenesis protein MshL [Sulfurimonas sp.]